MNPQRSTAVAFIFSELDWGGGGGGQNVEKNPSLDMVKDRVKEKNSS